MTSLDPSDPAALAPVEDPELISRVRANLASVRERITQAGGDPARVRIVAVTKTFPPGAALAAIRAGLVDLGENYAEELLRKAEALGQAEVAPRWHFLGALQRNKIGRLADVVASFDSVSRLVEGEAIARRRPGASVLVELDTTALPGRGGVSVEEVAPLVAALGKLDLVVEGLMTLAPPEPTAAARTFKLVDALRRDLGLREASMGMSEDLELAVAAGSTMVRVGRGLFGPRNLRTAVSQ